MTWAELESICRGYEVRLARTLELPRFMAATMINVNRKKNASPVKPEDIMPLITDRKKRSRLMTKEEFEELKRQRELIVWQSRN